MIRPCALLAPLRPSLVLAIALFSGATWAQAPGTAGSLADLPLDSLLDMPVNGTSRFVQRRSQAASAVTVITREEILAFGHRTLADVLRNVRGVTVTTDRTYHYLGVRGFLASNDYNTRVLLLVDGDRINDALFDQAFIGGEFPLDLDAVERIEFVPGQGSAVYGANALFGVINVITREAARQSQGQMTVGVGSAGDREWRASLHQPWGEGGLQLQVSRQVRRGDDFFDPARTGPIASDGWSRGADTTRRSAVYARLDLGGFTASLTHADRLKGTPLAVDLVFGDERSRYRDVYSLLNVERQFDLGGGSTRLTARAFAGRYRFDGDYVLDYPPITINRDIAVARWRGAELRVSHSGFVGHRLVAGAELQDVPELRQQNLDLPPQAASYLDDHRQSWRSALYAEDQWALTADWELHLGLRFDRSQHQQDRLSPRAALVWTPSESVAVKLIHGRAFRPPNAFESFYAVDAPAGYSLNPALQQERVRGSELVLDWRPHAHWRLSGSLFANHADRLLLLTYDTVADRYRFDNSATLRTQGGELEAEYARDGVHARTSYSWARTDGTDAALSFYPGQMLKGSVWWPLRGDWTAAVEAQALSRRGEAPGHALLNLTLAGPLHPGGPRLSAGLRNLADRQAFDPGFDPQRQPVVPLPGREWRLELRWPLLP